MTAFYGVLEPSTRTLTYSATGHNPPRLVRDGRVLSLDEGAGLPLGIFGEQPYGLTNVVLRPGDLLLLYTDGITEAMAPPKNGSRELFGLERLDPLLLSFGAGGAESCIQRILVELSAFVAETPRTDDQTLIAVRCL